MKLFAQPSNMRDRLTSFLPPLVATILYIVIFFPLQPFLGYGVSALSIFPVAIAGWFLGVRGGLAWSVFVFVIDLLLIIIEGGVNDPASFFKAGGPGFLSMIIVGVAAGWVRDLNIKINKELKERKSFEEALVISESRYRSQFENMVEGIAIDKIIYENDKPIDWIILDINPAYEKILSIKKEDAIGQYASKIYGSRETIEPFLSAYDLANRTGKPVTKTIQSWTGNRLVNFTAISLGIDQIAVLFSDITEQENAIKAELEQRKLAEAMRSIASALNMTIHLDEVLDIILEHMERFVLYDAADIMLIEEGRLRVKRHTGYQERGLREFIENFNLLLDAVPSARWIVENRKPLLISDTARSELWVVIPETSWIRSSLMIPIIAKGEMIGILNFLSTQPGIFDDVKMNQVLPFAEQAAIAIENARTFEETRLRAHRLALINRVTSRLNAPANLEQIQMLAVDCIAEALELDQVGLAMINKDRQTMTVTADHPAPGNSSVQGAIIPIENNPSMEIILQSKSSFLSEDAQHDSRLFAVRSFMVKQNIFSILIIPLVIRDEVIGTIGCDITEEGRRLSQEEISLAETLTSLVAGRLEQARLLEMEKQRAAEFAMLHETALAITQPYELSELLQQIVERAAWLLDSSAGMLYLTVPGQDVLECKVSFHNEFDPVGTRLRLGEGAVGIVAQTGQPLIISNYGEWEKKPDVFRAIAEPFGLLSVPVRWQSKIKGVIQLLRRTDEDPFTESDANLLSLFSSQVAISLENTQLYEEVQKLAVQDPLTGLYNRRGFTEIAQREFERARRFQRPLSLLFIDLDHFKKVNDTHGHPIGDQVLIGTASLWQRELRNVDVLCRYGGEEFVVLLMESNLVNAGMIGERLRATTERTAFNTENGDIQVTVSIGVAELVADMSGLNELIHLADQALYKAKSSGRNRVVCSEAQNIPE